MMYGSAATPQPPHLGLRSCTLLPQKGPYHTLSRPPKSEPLLMHYPQRQVSARYLGTEYGTSGHRSNSRRSGSAGSARSSPALVAASTSVIQALYRLACSIRGPEFLQQHRQKRELLSRQFGSVGVQQVLFEAAVLSGFSPSPSPSGPTMKNSGVTVPFLKASSPTERPQSVQSLNLCSVQFVRHFLLRVVATNGRKMGN